MLAFYQNLQEEVLPSQDTCIRDQGSSLRSLLLSMAHPPSCMVALLNSKLVHWLITEGISMGGGKPGQASSMDLYARMCVCAFWK